MEFQGFPSVAKPFLVILVVAILVRWVLFHERPEGWLKPAIMFGCLSLTGLLSLFYSPVPDRVWGRWTDDLKDIIIALVVIILLQQGTSFRRVLWVLIGVGFILGTLTVYQYFSGSFDNDFGGFAVSAEHQIIGTIDDYRSTGPIGDPNFFAQIMVVLVPISLERFLHEKRISLRLVALWTFANSVLSVIFTYSRGGLLALMMAVVVLLLYYPPKRLQIPIFILIIAGFIAFLPPNYVARLSTLTELFKNTGTTRVEERSLQGRLSENMTGWEMIKTHPLFGVGLSTYNYLFPTYSKKLGLALVATEREAHNLYLESLAETGIIGFSVLAWLLITSFLTVIRARKMFQTANIKDYEGMSTGFLAGLAGYFTAAAFIHNAFPRYFFLLLGIALSLQMVAKNSATYIHRVE